MHRQPKNQTQSRPTEERHNGDPMWRSAGPSVATSSLSSLTMPGGMVNGGGFGGSGGGYDSYMSGGGCGRAGSMYSDYGSCNYPASRVSSMQRAPSQGMPLSHQVGSAGLVQPGRPLGMCQSIDLIAHLQHVACSAVI